MLGDRLKEQRTKMKLRQEDVAIKLGIARTTYAMYEQGNREPDNDTLQKLADFFDVNIDYLLGRTDDPSPSPKKDVPSLSVFSKRLTDGLVKAGLSPEGVAEQCKVTTDYIQQLTNAPKKLPGATTLFRLAELLDVTPDYLAGYTDDPSGYHPLTPRPRDMIEFLDKEEVMFDGVPLSEDDKEKIKNVLTAVFMDAKKQNRRK